jgi:hypothetical protein
MISQRKLWLEIGLNVITVILAAPILFSPWGIWGALVGVIINAILFAKTKSGTVRVISILLIILFIILGVRAFLFAVGTGLNI